MKARFIDVYTWREPSIEISVDDQMAKNMIDICKTFAKAAVNNDDFAMAAECIETIENLNTALEKYSEMGTEKAEDGDSND